MQVWSVHTQPPTPNKNTHFEHGLVTSNRSRRTGQLQAFLGGIMSQSFGLGGSHYLLGFAEETGIRQSPKKTLSNTRKNTVESTEPTFFQHIAFHCRFPSIEIQLTH